MPEAIVPPARKKSTSSKAPAFQFYARDWLADGAVLAMSCAARGAYINLLAACWLEGSLPSDPVALRRIAGADSDEWKEISDAVLARFALVNGAFRHGRLDAERQKQRQFSKLQSDRRGHRKPTGTRPDDNRNATGTLPDDHSAFCILHSAEEEVHAPESEDAAYDVPADPVTDGARWFVESYPAWFAEERGGARCLRGSPQREFDAAKSYVATWPDRAYLEQMARTYLRSQTLNADRKHASRSMITFGWVASGIDAQLRGVA